MGARLIPHTRLKTSSSPGSVSSGVKYLPDNDIVHRVLKYISLPFSCEAFECNVWCLDRRTRRRSSRGKRRTTTTTAKRWSCACPDLSTLAVGGAGVGTIYPLDAVCMLGNLWRRIQLR